MLTEVEVDKFGVTSGSVAKIGRISAEVESSLLERLGENCAARHGLMGEPEIASTSGGAFRPVSGRADFFLLNFRGEARVGGLE